MILLAKKEIYRLNIKIDVNGDKKTKKKLTATERFAKRSEKRMKTLNKIRASPSVRLKDKLSKPLSKVESRISRFSKVAKSKLLAVATAGALLVGGIGIGASIKTFSNFEQGMKTVQATSQATNQEFKQLWDNAKDLGAKTAWSAKESSEGMNFLAMAGFKTNEIIEAMPGLLNLASAAGSDLGITADIVSDAITAFGLKAKDTTHLADIMAKASSTANTNVEMLGESFKYAAAPATAFGMSAEETTAALSMMANAGIKGSMAGTALRGALTRLTKPSDNAAALMKKLGIRIADGKGKIKPFNKIMDDTRKGLSKLSQEQKQNAIATIFGQEAMSGMLAVLNTSTNDFNKYTKSLKTADGTAKQMANTKLDSLSGQFTILKSGIEGMQIELGERLAPNFKKFVTWFTAKIPSITDNIVKVADKVSELATKFNNLSPEAKKFIGFLAVGTLTIGPFVKGIKGIMSLGSGIKGFFSLFKGAEAIGAASGATTIGAKAVAGLGAGLGAVSAPAVIATAAVVGVGVGAYKLKKHLEKDAIPAVDLFADKAQLTAHKFKDANGIVTNSFTKSTFKISENTKKAVGAYMSLDKQAENSLMQLKANSDLFTKTSKDKVLNNFLSMSKNVTKVSSEMKNNMTTEFKNIISKTGTLTNKNKAIILKKYMDMVKGCTKLTDKQRQSAICNFNKMLQESTAITKKQKDSIITTYNEMSSKIKDNIDKRKNAHLNTLKDFFNKSTTLTTKEESAILTKTTEGWENKKKVIASYQQKITSILQNANKNNRKVSDDELKEIGTYKEKMKTLAVQYLSDQEVESNVILERMKHYNERITAETAAQNIQKLNEQRDTAIKIANEECDKRLAAIIRARDETHSISAQQAETLIADATKQRDEIVGKAEETRKDAVEKITSMNDTIAENVDTTTGKIISNADKMHSKWDNWNPKEHNCFVNFIHRIFSSEEKAPQPKRKMTTEEFLKMKEHGYATGTNNATKGIHPVAENGYEIVIGKQSKIFNGGEKVLNHKDSEKFIKNNNTQNKQFNVPIAQPKMNLAGTGNINVDVDVKNNFNGNTDVDKIVSEATKQFAIKLKQSLENIKK